MISNIIASSVVICLVLGLALLVTTVAFGLYNTWVEKLATIALGYAVCWILAIILILLLNAIWRWF